MVSIMPCTAKKAEAVRPNSFTKGEQDTDIVITTTELLRMIDNFGIKFSLLEPEACDMPFGFGSGGGVIFGVTGGVTEAVLRRLTNDHSKEAMHEIAESGVRGEEGIARSRNFAAPPNTVRLGCDTPCAKIGQCGNCLNDTICCQIVVTRASRVPGRIKVILVGEELGY